MATMQGDEVLRMVASHLRTVKEAAERIVMAVGEEFTGIPGAIH